MQIIFIISIVFGVLAVWTGSACAELEMGGTLAVDVYHYSQDKEGYGAGRTTGRGTPGTGGYAGVNDAHPTMEEDRRLTFIDFNKASVFWMKWTSAKGVGILISPYLKGDATQSLGTGSLNVGIALAYGWWDVTPSFRLAVGKGENDVFSPYDPYTSLGYDGVSKCMGVGYGNIVSKYQNGVVLTYNVNDRIKTNLGFMESRLTDPNNVNYTSMNPELKAEPGAYVDNSTQIPKIEFSVPMTFGQTEIVPSGMWIKQTFDNIAIGADDSITAWGVSLAAKKTIGALTIKGEIQHGQNWYNASKLAVSTPYPFKSEYAAILGFAMSAKADASGKIYDSDNTAFWCQVSYRLRQWLIPLLIYGQQTVKRDIPSQESDIRTQMYGVSCPIFFSHNFSVAPELMVYDSGDGNTFVSAYAPGNSEVYDCGKEILAGAQFRFFF